MPYVALGLLGAIVGALGTLVGAGGGFILAPVLVLLYPDDPPATLASISLAVVFFNASSGTAAYLRQRRVDVRSGVRFSAAAIPGSVLGAVAVGYLRREAFELILGLVLIGAAAWLLVSRRPEGAGGAGGAGGAEAGGALEAANVMGPRIPHHRGVAGALSFGVGFVSSLLGIGGGIIHVPALVRVLGFPVHVATATSHFVLATTAGAGTATHLATGAFHTGWRRTIALGLGAVIGAQIGARWARLAPPSLILRALAVALLLVGGRVLVQAAGLMGR